MARKTALTQFTEDVEKGVLPKSGRMQVDGTTISFRGRGRGEKEERVLRTFDAGELVKMLMDRNGPFRVTQITRA